MDFNPSSWRGWEERRRAGGTDAAFETWKEQVGWHWRILDSAYTAVAHDQIFGFKINGWAPTEFMAANAARRALNRFDEMKWAEERDYHRAMQTKKQWFH